MGRGEIGCALFQGKKFAAGVSNDKVLRGAPSSVGGSEEGSCARWGKVPNITAPLNFSSWAGPNVRPPGHNRKVNLPPFINYWNTNIASTSQFLTHFPSRFVIDKLKVGVSKGKIHSQCTGLFAKKIKLLNRDMDMLCH